ncbi:non-muscle cofilin 1-like isoform X2 [Puntigrus tetrazona]|uniref:non-muscle cofilin 1-like isoform X2 n=1 Tax=Puntigrus tetrazona TaxID=1606681 RepID=UPI001C88E410|nr:non-muscle cofilin 1-like isoform X2 [Puntigrus tetrazona]
MASGVAISDEVINQKSIVVDHDNCLTVKDVGTTDVLKKILDKFPPKDCRYGLYDCSYVNKESVKEDLVFILSAPESAPLKSKMVYASSMVALKNKLQGLKYEWQINEPGDRDPSCLVEKLGGRDTVKSLEGQLV